MTQSTDREQSGDRPDAHDCERELEGSPEFDRFRCRPEVFDCSCGKRYYHACDEAEGCSWVLVGLVLKVDS